MATPRRMRVQTGFERKTVRLGDATPRKTEKAARRFDPEASYTKAALGSPARTQLTRLLGNGRDWSFGSLPPIAVYCSRDATKLVDLTLVPGSFTSEVVNVATATQLQVTWSAITAIAGDTSSVVLTGTLDPAIGAMKWTMTVTLSVTAGHAGDTHSIAKCSHNWSVAAYEAANLDDYHLVAPEWQGRTRPNPTQVFPVPVRLNHPGGGVVWPDSNTENGTAHLFAQYVALVARSARAALIVRTNDNDGRHKRWVVQGDGAGSTLVGVEHYPANNAAAKSYTTPYETWLVPLAGERWDVENWYRNRIVTEAPAWLPLPLKDNALRPVPASTDVVNSDFWYWVNLKPHSLTTRAEEAVHALEDLRRIKEALPGRQIMVLVYMHHTNDFGKNHPDWFPYAAGVQQFLDDCNAEGFKVWPYTIDGWGQVSTWTTATYNPAFGVPTDAVCKKVDGTNKTIALDPAVPQGTHFLPNFGHVAAGVRQPREHWSERVNAMLITGFGGTYLDGWPDARDDHNAVLAPADRGSGSPFEFQGRKDLMATHKGSRRATKPQFGYITEFDSELLLSHLDGTSMWTVTLSPELTARWVSSHGAIYGDRIRTYGFDIWGVWPPDKPPDYYEALAYNAALSALQGKIPGAQHGFWASGSYLIQKPGDANYASSWPVQQLYVTFLLGLVEFIATHGLKSYFMGQKLRPMQGSHERWMEDNGPGWGLTSDGLFIRPTNMHAMSGVFQHKEEAQEPIGIFLVNPSVEIDTVTISIDASDYPLLRSGGGAIKRVLCARSGATRSPLMEFDGALRWEVTLDPYSARLYELVETA